MPEETVVSPASLNNAQRGQLAELIFIRKAASLGFAVAKPWNEGERYDAIVRVGHVLWRVQVKSTLAKCPLRPYYRVSLAANPRPGRSGVKPYSTDEIDFLVAYIFAEDIWYVFPAARVVGHKSVCLYPGSKRSRIEQYREAWHLMRVDESKAIQPSAESCKDATGSSSSTQAAAGDSMRVDTSNRLRASADRSGSDANGSSTSTQAVAADCVGSVGAARGTAKQAEAARPAARAKAAGT